MNLIVIREYLGNNVEFKMINGNVYANATSIAGAFDNGSQKLKDWKRSSKTKELIEELNKIKGVEFSHSLVLSEEGRKGGTWIHEKLVLDLARYLSISFSVWCDEQIATLIREGSVIFNPKSEEDMLLELFPTTDKNLVTLTAQNIRLVKKLEIENKYQKEQLEHKKNVINNLTSEIDSVLLRRINTDYVNRIVFNSDKEHSEIYGAIYNIIERKLKIDLKHQYDLFIQKERDRVEKNKKVNAEKKLSGIDLKIPFRLKDSKCYISKIEFICDILKQGGLLLETMSKVFNVPVVEIIEKYNFCKEELELEQKRKLLNS